MPDDLSSKRDDLARMIQARAKQQVKEALLQLRTVLSQWCRLHLGSDAWLPEVGTRVNYNPTPIMRRVLLALAQEQSVSDRRLRLVPKELLRVAEMSITQKVVEETEKIAEMTARVLDTNLDPAEETGDIPDDYEMVKRHYPHLVENVPAEESAEPMAGATETEEETEDGKPNE